MISYYYRVRTGSRIEQLDEQVVQPYLIEMMSSKGMVQQLVLVHSPEQIPVEQCHVIGDVLGRQCFKVHVRCLRRYFLLGQGGLPSRKSIEYKKQ